MHKQRTCITLISWKTSKEDQSGPSITNSPREYTHTNYMRKVLNQTNEGRKNIPQMRNSTCY